MYGPTINYTPWPNSRSRILLNLRSKAQKIPGNKVGEVWRIAITQEDEAFLFFRDDLPEYFTRSFLRFNQLIREAESNPTNIQQVDFFLESDPCFKYRYITNSNGDVIGYVWQTGVICQDFELLVHVR
jgi:hypothetical protein